MRSRLSVSNNKYHKLGMRHVLLLSLYVLYLLFGATAFYILEHDLSEDIRQSFTKKLHERRSNFIQMHIMPEIFNNTDLWIYIHQERSDSVFEVLYESLSTYESELDLHSPTCPLPWTYRNAILYCWSLITTIGYGYIYPATIAARVLSLIYQAFGIPFTLIVLKDLTCLLAKLLNMPGKCIAAIWHAFRFCTLKAVDERSLYALAASSNTAPEEGAISTANIGETQELDQKVEYRRALHTRMRTLHRMLNIPTLVVILALIGWMALGSVLLCSCEQKWSTFDSIYFLFNSLTTAGIGDLRVDNSHCLLSVFIYIFIGLAVVLLFINLLVTKLSLAYWLPEQLAALPHLYYHLSNNVGEKELISRPRCASFDDDISLTDIDLASYVSLGIVHIEDSRPLLGVLANRTLPVHRGTQTLGTSKHSNIQSLGNVKRPQNIYSQLPGTVARETVGTTDNPEASVEIAAQESVAQIEGTISADDIGTLLEKPYHPPDKIVSLL